ncbi:MAG: EAL domain-containing protein [Acidobacteriota bacterium]|nr:EAL domain-containing protein [Acidobacteriota bacterium]
MGKRSRGRDAIPLAMVMRLGVVTWLLTGMAHAQQAMHALWFWAGLVGLLIATGMTASRERERSYLFRESTLKQAVKERTVALEAERRKEQAGRRILEMLVSNEALGAVLDAVLRSIRLECSHVACAILLKRGDSCHIAAAAGVPGEWLTALRVARAVPFEVWLEPVSGRKPSLDPAWKIFQSHVSGAAPGIVFSRPVRATDAQPGAILFFYPAGTEPREADEEARETGERLARLAVEQNRLYDSLQYQAQHDSLTGLPNRALFEERLVRSVREAEITGQIFAVFFVDLDLFKRVNDTFSHRTGDLFLCEIAMRMKKALRPDDVVARIGGDEFTIVLNNLREKGEATEVAGRVLEAVRQPMFIDGHELGSSASIGIAFFPDDGADAEILQRAADAAMYCAKNLGRDRAEVFSTRNELLDRARMDEELRLALRENYFVIHYQPKVTADRKFAGFEALIRMGHPVHGEIAPLSFIPAAEANGLIVPIGAWALDEVCRQIADWNGLGLSPISVAVNVSPLQICRSDFAKSVECCLRRHNVPPSSLEIELTESLLINAAGVAQGQLRELRKLGVQLSIDDFGTGYSSLSYLHRLPVDGIKLDKSFVQSIDTDPLAHRLVQAMIGVAQGLGLTVVAEGVETEGQREALLQAGCSLMQGFLFSAPHPAAEVAEFLRPARAVAAEPIPVDHTLLRLSASIATAAAFDVGVSA